MVFLRTGFAALLLLIVWRPKLDKTVREHAGLLLLFGASIAVMNLCFYHAIARIPLGIAVTIEFLGPLGIAVATTRRLPELMWIAVALIGVALLSPDIGETLDPLGVVFAAVAGACWGSFVLLSVRIGKLFEHGSGLALGMTVASLLLLPFGYDAVGTAFSDPFLLAAAFGVALLSTTIPLSLEFEALKRIPPRVYGVLITLEPAIAVLVGVVLLSESLTPRILLAVGCVTLAAVMITRMARNRGPDAA